MRSLLFLSIKGVKKFQRLKNYSPHHQKYPVQIKSFFLLDQPAFRLIQLLVCHRSDFDSEFASFSAAEDVSFAG
jgi:hypothetical protein